MVNETSSTCCHSQDLAIGLSFYIAADIFLLFLAAFFLKFNLDKKNLNYYLGQIAISIMNST